MNFQRETSLVKTIRERCRVCYTCVRECPAKAIQIKDGQADVIPERCIGCGNCVRVCSQNAKQVLQLIDPVVELLGGSQPVAAAIAPSFPGAFGEVEWGNLVTGLRELGFAYVNEVAFGADLVAAEYRRLLDSKEDKRAIATTCPAIVAYVERYHPDMVKHLAPIVSPMVATARVLRRLHGDDLRVVFIGPCVAKKGEAMTSCLPGDVDAALTFTELRNMFEAKNIELDKLAPSDFDPPFAGMGRVFAISRGLLQAAEMEEDLMQEQVVVADGRNSFVEALKNFESGDLKVKLLEILACQGCIMGPGMDCDSSPFTRRSKVGQFAREMMEKRDADLWRKEIESMSDLDLTRTYKAQDQRIPVPFSEEIDLILKRIGKSSVEDELNCGACGYESCREHAVAIFKGLAESEMCLPNTIEQLRSAVQDLAVSNDQLVSTQEALMHSEKLASMGQLAAGIAHEVNNPLGVVLMYAHLLLEEADKHGELSDDLGMIVEQADRCKKIVAGLLNFSRQNKVARQPVDAADLVRKAVKALAIDETIKVVVDVAAADPNAEIDPDQISQVLTNLISNAVAAMPDGGTLTITIDSDEWGLKLMVQDTGVGIPPENMKKIFEPFFTTKQIGKGTGLGLAVTYGIIKMHSGDIQVASNTDPNAGPTGATFTIKLPKILNDE
ncbi:MAG: 4Fe-4S binding protein [Phycisphaerales bacterium]|jgi:signal transduction histidine kinase/iron only hydrogenase large subunit-like protein|nr:4Fe-4S binding protein [Phycisphaerales bacterium]